MRTRAIHTVASSLHGQALVEFVIAILMVVIVVAGTLQFIEMAGMRGELMAEIRGEAGQRALSPLNLVGNTPEYLRTWEEGPDALRHTADDRALPASESQTLQVRILDRTDDPAGDGRILDGVVNADLPLTRAAARPMSTLGMLHVERREAITLSPAMRDWVYGRERVTVGAEVWMPRLRLEGFDP